MVGDLNKDLIIRYLIWQKIFSNNYIFDWNEAINSYIINKEAMTNKK